MKTELQKSIDQIGIDTVVRCLRGANIHYCEMHGHYATAKDSEPTCPVCALTVGNGTGNGTTATEVEHYIDIKDKCIDI